MKPIIVWTKQRIVRLLTWLKYIFSLIYRGSAQGFETVFVTELPDHLRTNKLYAVGDGTPWLAVILCPCGCNEAIHLSLLPDDSPSWSLSIDEDNKPSLHPSVWRSKGCKAHFFLKRGSVDWC